MPRRVKGPDGVVRAFPDDASDDEISQTLEAAQPKPESWGRMAARAALETLPSIGGIVGGALSTPESFGIGTVPGAALGVGAGRGLRDLIGHATGLDAPSTPGDKAINIAKDTAIAGAAGVLMPGVATAIKTPIQTAREGVEQFASAMPPTIRRLGRLFPSLPKGAAAPIYERPVNVSPMWANEAAAPTAETARTGTGFLRTGTAQPGGASWQGWSAAKPAAGAAVAEGSAAPVMSQAEKAALSQQGFTPDAIARIEQAATRQAAPMASHAPTSAPTSAPVAAAVPPSEPSPLQGPRIQTGAERVGRSAGMTKQEVRTATGPVLDEAAGDASPILPQKALQRIIDDIRALPKGGPEREAYVARATSGKTKAQVENARRTLEHLGLIVPVAAAIPDVRSGLMKLMASHQQTGS